MEMPCQSLLPPSIEVLAAETEQALRRYSVTCSTPALAELDDDDVDDDQSIDLTESTHSLRRRLSLAHESWRSSGTSAATLTLDDEDAIEALSSMSLEQSIELLESTEPDVARFVCDALRAKIGRWEDTWKIREIMNVVLATVREHASDLPLSRSAMTLLHQLGALYPDTLVNVDGVVPTIAATVRAHPDDRRLLAHGSGCTAQWCNTMKEHGRRARPEDGLAVLIRYLLLIPEALATNTRNSLAYLYLGAMLESARVSAMVAANPQAVELLYSIIQAPLYPSPVVRMAARLLVKLCARSHCREVFIQRGLADAFFRASLNQSLDEEARHTADWALQCLERFIAEHYNRSASSMALPREISFVTEAPEDGHDIPRRASVADHVDEPLAVKQNALDLADDRSEVRPNHCLAEI